MIIQFCGLSGSGKTTIAQKTKEYFRERTINIEILDGDEYREFLSPDLGFTKEDRNINIRRLAFVASKLSQYNIIPVICAINPYDEIRKEVISSYSRVKTIYIKCSLTELIKRDTKGMYAKALLPDGHADKIYNLSGVNDPFETPCNSDLIIETDKQTISESSHALIQYIETNL